MAGGTFDKNVSKVRPGTYINFESTRTDLVGGSVRGIVVIPLISMAYGLQKQFITLQNTAPDAAFDKLGYSIYDGAQPDMVNVREAFKRAQTVIVYNASTGGTKASGTGGGLSATAKYEGTRGNSLTYAVVANPVSGFDVTVTLAGSKVSEYKAVTSADSLANDLWITFTASGDLAAEAGVTLAGGVDATRTNTDITDFLAGLEGIRFNTLAFTPTDTSLFAACVTTIKGLRENSGKYVKAVVSNYNADYEGIINVTNGVVIGDTTLPPAKAVAWVAGADAAATNTESLTYSPYEGATGISGVKTNEQAIAAINNGEFFFSMSEAGTVVVETDINSLVTLTADKDKTYRKNRVIRVLDTFGDAIKAEFPPNKFNNTDEGWDVMEGVGRAVLMRFLNDGAIQNVDYENDFVVDRGSSSGDETYFEVALQPVDSAEKLYFTVSTR
jgi:hypothetical protein